MKRLLLTCVFLSTSPWAISQTLPHETSTEPIKKFAIKTPNLKIDPFIQLQAWGVRSLERSTQLDADSNLDSAEQRTNFYLRRGRFGFRSKPYENLSFMLSLYYDNTGHDSMGATRGGTNPGASGGPATVGVWDSFLTWKLSESDLFHVSAGYFTPQISRDSITSPFRISSFEQAPSQNYVRRSVIGRNFGRSTGINIGGQKYNDGFGINYNLGAFNKNTTSAKKETQGDDNSLVYVGRVAATFGDAEMSKYGFGYQTNFFGRRNGLTLALNGSTQERTELYKSNRVIGADMLFNYKNLNIDSEFFYLYKKNLGEDSYARARTGHFRMSYNFFLKNGTVLEPALMVSNYFGEEGSDNTGRDTVYDIGLNWYLDENNYKLYVHYVNQDGDGSNIVHKDGTSGYHYGDFVGVGLTLQF